MWLWNFLRWTICSSETKLECVCVCLWGSLLWCPKIWFIYVFFLWCRASVYPREYDGACLQMRLSYSPAAHLFLFLVQWTGFHLAGALGLLRILIYKVVYIFFSSLCEVVFSGQKSIYDCVTCEFYYSKKQTLPYPWCIIIMLSRRLMRMEKQPCLFMKERLA